MAEFRESIGDIPLEPSPALSDTILTLRGNGVGAERRPSWLSVLKLFRRNLQLPLELDFADPVATNATLSSSFFFTAEDDFTLANPTGALDGQTLLWRIKQDATGNRAPTLGSKFRMPVSATDPLPWSTAAGRTDYLLVKYNAEDDAFDVVSFNYGYE